MANTTPLLPKGFSSFSLLCNAIDTVAIGLYEEVAAVEVAVLKLIGHLCCPVDTIKKPMVTQVPYVENAWVLLRSEAHGHEHQPVAQELQRMAVMSFDKPVRLWDPDNAPVNRGRFEAYKRIANQMGELLMVA